MSKIDDFIIEDGVLTKYEGRGSDVVIPDGVTSINDVAFFSCSSVTSVTIPDSVTSIGKGAFYGCRSLMSITIPDSVTSIGEDAFHDCDNLTSISVPDSVTSIGRSAFSGSRDTLPKHNSDGFYALGRVVLNADKNAVDVIIPDSETSIGDRAFFGCINLSIVTIPYGVTSINKWAFSYCYSLTSVTILDNITCIGENAFYSCRKLTSITIPNSVISIGNEAFNNCESLKNVFAQSLKGWLHIQFKLGASNPCHNGAALFIGGKPATHITIPDGVSSIGDYAFYGCSSLTSVTIPNGVTGIGEEAFYGCSSLTSITIPDSVTSIGAKAFYHCTNLREISVSGLINSLGYKAFSDIIASDSESKAKLTITIRGKPGPALLKLLSTEKTLRECAVYSNDLLCSEVPIYARKERAIQIADTIIQGHSIPDKVYQSYLRYFSAHITEWFDNYEKDYHPIIQLIFREKLIKITEIDSLIKSVSKNMNSELLNMLMAYQKENFGLEDYDRQTEKEFRKMERYAVVRSDPTSQKYINAVWTVGRKEPHVKSLKDVGAVVIFPKQIGKTIVKGIADGFEFRSDDHAREKIEEIVIPEGYTCIGDNAFSNCVNLKKITLPGSITRIGCNAFSNCNNLKMIYFGSLDKWLAIDKSEWEDTPLRYGGLLYLDGECVKNPIIPEGTARIFPKAFAYCCQLTGVTIPDSVKIIGDEAFFYCEGLTSVSIPQHLEQIGKRAFQGCRSLKKSVIIPESVTEVGDWAFSDCKNLTHTVLPGSFVHKLPCVFDGCKKLNDIRFSGTVSDIGDDEIDGEILLALRFDDEISDTEDDEIDDDITPDHDTVYENIPFLKNIAKFKKMFVFGETVPYSALKREMELNDNISYLASQLIWDAMGVRFYIDGNNCFTCNGLPFTPVGNITLAHPVEIDAEEILAWRELLTKRHIVQPFNQMWEPVVLCNGTLKGEFETVKAAGEEYRMSCRYKGAVMTESETRILEREGFNLVIREKRRYDDWSRSYTTEISVVNIVTPMGILYNCQPLSEDSMSFDFFSEDEFELSLGEMLPFDSVRLRTVNHTAVVLERILLPWLIENNKLEILLPYLINAGKKELQKMYSKAVDAHRNIADIIVEIAALKGIEL